MKPFWGTPDDRQVVPTGSNAVGTRCRASEVTGILYPPTPRYSATNVDYQ
jgi:hypothetical protein